MRVRIRVGELRDADWDVDVGFDIVRRAWVRRAKIPCKWKSDAGDSWVDAWEEKEYSLFVRSFLSRFAFAVAFALLLLFLIYVWENIVIRR